MPASRARGELSAVGGPSLFCGWEIEAVGLREQLDQFNPVLGVDDLAQRRFDGVLQSLRPKDLTRLRRDVSVNLDGRSCRVGTIQDRNRVL